MNFKKFTAGVLAALMFASSVSYEELWKRPTKEPVGKEPVANAASNAELQATNSLGNYLVQMSQTKEQEKQKLVNDAIAENEFAIGGLAFDAATGVVAVKTTQAADCTLRVRVLNDDDGKEVAVSEKAMQRGKDTVTQLEFNAEAFPEYFKIQAELIGPMQDMLCVPFTLSDYTREVQEIKAADINDFEPEYVVNLDEKEDTNFVVLKEGTKMAASSETTNTLVSADYENNVFVFENADATITELKQGDYFYIQPDVENLIAIIVESIEIADNQVTIIGNDENIEDLFSFVKIEINAEEHDLEMKPIDVTVGGTTVSSEASTEAVSSETTTANSAESFVSLPLDTSAMDTAESETANITETDAMTADTSSVSNVTETDAMMAETSSESTESFESVAEATDPSSETNQSVGSGFGNYQFNEEAPAANDHSSASSFSFGNDDVSLKGEYKVDDDSASCSFEMNLKDMFTVSVGYTETFQFYKKWDYIYTLFQTSITSTVSLSIGVDQDNATDLINKLTKDNKDDWLRIDIAHIFIPTPASGIVLKLVPSLFLNFEGKITLGYELNASMGFIYDSEADEKARLLFGSPDELFSPKITVEGEVQAGILLTIQVNVFYEKFFSVKLTGKLGAYATGELDLQPNVVYAGDSVILADTTDNEIHNCKWCAKGEMGIVIGAEAGLEVLGMEFNLELFTKKIKLGDYYCSKKNGKIKMAFGECPSKAYKTEFNVWDELAARVVNAEVEVDGVKMYTDGNGYVHCYCTEGSHRYVVREDNFVRGEGTFNVPPGTKKLDITISEKGSAGVRETGIAKGTTTSYTTSRPETTTSTTNEKMGSMKSIESGQLGDNVHYILHNDGYLQIYGSGDMYENCNVIRNKDKIKAAIIYNVEGNEITSIGGSLFSNCTNMTSVELPDTITKIHNDAFYNCSSLESIDIPDGVTYIGEYAFEGCETIPEFTLPSELKYIGKLAFGRCISITEMMVPSKVTEIGTQAFYGCSSMTKLVIPQSVTKIGNTIAGNTKLEEVTLPFMGNTPEGVAANNTSTLLYLLYGGTGGADKAALRRVTITGGSSIPKSAFANFTDVTEINLPDTITKIHNNAFYNCTGLERIMFTGNAPVIASDAFNDVTTNAYYPKNDTTWTADKLQNYSGTITWIPITPLTITEQPKNAVAPAGETVTFKVSAAGDDLTYKWYFKNKSGSKFLYTSSFNSNTYTAVMNETRDGRQVYCVITDKYGNSVKTNVVTLIMGNPVKLVEQPRNAVAPNGETIKIAVGATGDGLTYKWYFKNKGASKFSYTSSFSSNTYTAIMNGTRDGRQVYCVITDKYDNSIQTDAVTLTMGNPVKLVEQPKNVVAPEGTNAKIVINATGDDLTYKWYFKNKGASKFSYTPTFKTNTYSAVMNEVRDGRQVYCVITDKYGNRVKRDVVTMTMINPVKIVEQPQNAVALEGKAATSTVEATGDGLTYKWYYKNKGASEFIYTSSFKSNTYTAIMNETREGRQIYCVITDQYGNSVQTDTVTLIVGNTLKITEQPTNASAAEGASVKTRVRAAGDGLKYQWYYCEVGSTTFKLSGVKTNTYSAAMTAAKNGRKVYCVITDQYGVKVKTDVVTLTME